MVLGLKPMGKLIAFDNYLSIRQNQGLAPEAQHFFFATLRVLSMLGSLDFLLSLSYTWVLEPNAWEK